MFQFQNLLADAMPVQVIFSLNCAGHNALKSELTDSESFAILSRRLLDELVLSERGLL